MNIKLESDKVIKDRKLVRNEYMLSKKSEMPIIKKINITDDKFDFISYSNTKKDERNRNKTVHFFNDDSKFNGVYNSYNIEQVEKLAQYKYILTPDFSVTVDMPLPVQMKNVFKSRWCGAYWQDYNLKVIPTITWSDHRSYNFCFEGIEKGSPVAISTLGCRGYRRYKQLFIEGYQQMMKSIMPELIICYGKPFLEMEGNIKHIEYIFPGGGLHGRER